MRAITGLAGLYEVNGIALKTHALLAAEGADAGVGAVHVTMTRDELGAVGPVCGATLGVLVERVVLRFRFREGEAGGLLHRLGGDHGLARVGHVLGPRVVVPPAQLREPEGIGIPARGHADVVVCHALPPIRHAGVRRPLGFYGDETS